MGCDSRTGRPDNPSSRRPKPERAGLRLRAHRERRYRCGGEEGTPMRSVRACLAFVVCLSFLAWPIVGLSAPQLNDLELARSAQAVLAKRCSACHSGGGASKGV